MHTKNPTTIVVFGATGDLFRKKIAPALINLYVSGQLPNFFRVVAFTRRPWSDGEFRNFLKEILDAEMPLVSPEVKKVLLDNTYHVSGEFELFSSYEKVAELLSRIDTEAGVCSNKLFYVSTPPAFYETILKHVSDSGLAIPCALAKTADEAGWTRILIEKPFGSNLDSALKLDKMLGKLFTESQIFRIDHYLAKETVQNILSFRFANALFEPVWNNKYIDRVEIKLLEKSGVGTRGASYEAVGALRDVGQNHVLQLLALSAMENPVSSSAQALRKKRAEALTKFKLATGKNALVVRAQYDEYRNENGVSKDSETETYFKVQLTLNNHRFRGVPFIIESGKGLVESKVEIVVYFKQAFPGLCPAGVCPFPGNMIIFRVQPDEHISLAYWAKKPGLDFALESKELALTKAASAAVGDALGAYERVLIDAIRGDQTLFASTDEVIAQWKITQDIFKKWTKNEILKYPKGTTPNF
ncbi:MAG: glucose-6-phosphate dehydrogenase [Patescibacteria group bacterium]